MGEQNKYLYSNSLAVPNRVGSNVRTVSITYTPTCGTGHDDPGVRGSKGNEWVTNQPEAFGGKVMGGSTERSETEKQRLFGEFFVVVLFPFAERDRRTRLSDGNFRECIFRREKCDYLYGTY